MSWHHALRVTATLATILAGVATAVLAETPPRPHQDKELLAPRQSPPTTLIQNNNSCISACRAQYHECLIATKGSPSCSAQQDACLRNCLRR
jgi:hypothetical protein